MPNTTRLLGVLALFTLVACQPQAAPSAPGVPPAPKPVVEQKAVFATTNVGNSLDPQQQITTARRFDIFDSILMMDGKGEPGPAIATEWKLINPTTWQFTIRTDVRFHDGTPLTVEDVKYTLDRALNPANRLPLAARLSTISGSSVVDARTIQIVTSAPDPILRNRLSTTSVIPKAYTERVGTAEFALKPIGSGPFKVKEFRSDDLLVLTGVPDHAFRAPKLTELTIKVVPETSTRIAGLQSGEIDMATLLPIEQFEKLKAAGLNPQVVGGGSAVVFFLDSVVFDKPIDGPTADKRVRQALNYAVNKDAISKEIFGGLSQPSGQIVGATTFGYNPNIKPYPYDPAKAKQLLAEAGYANGFTIKAEATAALPAFLPVGLTVQQNLKDIGVTLDLNIMQDNSQWRDRFYGVSPRAPMFGIPLQTTPLLDGDAALTWFWSKQAPPTRHANNAEFDRYYEATRTELDVPKRRELLQKASEAAYEDANALFLMQSAGLQGSDPKRIAGYNPAPDGDTRFDLIYRVG